MSRLLRSAAIAALTLAACAVTGAASAQTYNRLVVFGDSLSDNGNLYAITSGARPPAPIYWQGRFSNGPVFTELLGFNAGRITAGAPVTGSVNLAFGGARTDASTAPPGMRTQLGMYQMGGGTFGANDLVSVLGGANNIFQGLEAFGDLPAGSPALANPTGYMTPIALGAAADVNAIVGAIATGGAGTILVTNLPKLSLTPAFRGTAAAPLADFAVGQFNGALSTGVFATAAARPGTNIILMDLFKVGDTIAGNPGAFGISNVTQPCFNELALTVCPNPNDYFYFDGVHPTAAGHAVIARLANDYLYYGDLGAGTALQAETAARHRQDGLDAASEALSGRAGWSAGTAISVGALIDRTSTDARGSVAESDSDGYGVRIALESGPSTDWRFGMAGTYRRAEVEGGAHSFDLNTFGLDIYGGWRSGDVFVNAAAGVADDKYDTERVTALGPVTHTGSTRGFSKGARLQGGLWMDMGGLAISPRAAVTWTSSDVDGYVEQGVAAQYAYGDRTLDGVTAEIALRAEGAMGPFGFYAEGGYRDNLDDGGDPVRVGISGSPSHVLDRQIEDAFGGQFLASAGVEGTVGPVNVSFGYRGRFGDNADSHMGAIKLSLPL